MEKSKCYGRININKLDWLLAIICAIFATAIVWLSIILTIKKAGAATIPAFLDFVHGLGFIWKKSDPSVGVVVLTSIYFYLGLILLVCGSIYLVKKERKERIPGLVAAFIGIIDFLLLLAIVFEFTGGVSKGSIPLFWPYSSIIFLVALGVGVVLSVFGAFSKYDISLDKCECCECKEKEEVIKETKVVKEKTHKISLQHRFAFYYLISSIVIIVVCITFIFLVIFGKHTKTLYWYHYVFFILALLYAISIFVLEIISVRQKKHASKEEEKVVEQVTTTVVEETTVEEDEEDNLFEGLGKRRERVPFETKLRRSSDAKVFYKEIVEVIKEYKVTGRRSIPGEAYSYRKERLVFFTIGGSTLKVYFAIDPDKFKDSTIPVKDASDVKKFERTPSYLKVKSSLAARRAIRLIRRVFTENNIPKLKK